MTDTESSFVDQVGNLEYVVENFDIYEFLTEYEKRPELWDKNHQCYRNKLIRLESERGLCKKLQIPDLKALRRKIRSVRGSYNAVIGRVRESLQADDGETYVTKLAWFPIADRFLRVTTDVPLDVEIPMELKLQNSECEPEIDKKTIMKSIRNPKTQFIIADTKSLAKSAEVFIEDGTYSYEEIETTYNVDESGNVENTNNFQMDNIANPEYIITDNGENTGEGETIAEEFLDLDSSSNPSECDETNNDNVSHVSKKQKKGQCYVVQNQIRSYRLDNCKPYNVKNRIHNNKTENVVNTEEKESGIDNIINYLKDIASERENEFMVFGKAIGMQLSALPMELAVQLQSDIQRHITKVRMNYLRETENNADSADVETVCD